MSGRYLLDINTSRYVIKGNIPRVRERLLNVPMAQLAVSAVTEAEPLFGVACKPEATRLKAAVEEFLLRVEDSEAARHYADVRATLERHGKPMENLDMMIAAHALAVEAILATNDRASRRLGKLKLEDWTK
jgi:tRNA(fMet)-specific endonuclease VapC